jgi:hypothetical protein
MLSGFKTNLRSGNVSALYSLDFLPPFSSTLSAMDRVSSSSLLLRPLPPREQAPCCSNLTWLMTRIANSSLTPVSLNAPTYLVIDDLDYLAVIAYSDKLYRFNRTTMAQVSSKWIASNCTAMSYYNKQYFISESICLEADIVYIVCHVGCGTASTSMVYAISTSNLSSITNISVPSEPRDVKFIRNGTVMLVSMLMPNTIGFYNVSSNNRYTLTSNMSAPGLPYSMYRVNDTLLHVSILWVLTPIHTLVNTGGMGGWTWGSFPATRSSAFTSNFQSTFDACGRMWVSTTGFGIRIFDATGSQSLYNWSRTIGMNGIVVTEKFDVYIADVLYDLVTGYYPHIQQCTS